MHALTMHSVSQLAAVAAPFHSSGLKNFVGRLTLEKLYELQKGFSVVDSAVELLSEYNLDLVKKLTN